MLKLPRFNRFLRFELSPDATTDVKKNWKKLKLLLEDPKSNKKNREKIFIEIGEKYRPCWEPTLEDCSIISETDFPDAKGFKFRSLEESKKKDNYIYIDKIMNRGPKLTEDYIGEWTIEDLLKVIDAVVSVMEEHVGVGNVFGYIMMTK